MSINARVGDARGGVGNGKENEPRNKATRARGNGFSKLLTQ
jgi:hypothetical protein